VWRGIYLRALDPCGVGGRHLISFTLVGHVGYRKRFVVSGFLGKMA
jgi:hypothetical protein